MDAQREAAHDPTRRSPCRDGPDDPPRRPGAADTQASRAGAAAPVHHVRRRRGRPVHRRQRFGAEPQGHRHPGQHGPAGLRDLHDPAGGRPLQAQVRRQPTADHRRCDVHRSVADAHHRLRQRGRLRRWARDGLRVAAGGRCVRSADRAPVLDDDPVLPAAGLRHRHRDHRPFADRRRHHPDHRRFHPDVGRHRLSDDPSGGRERQRGQRTGHVQHHHGRIPTTPSPRSSALPCW